jgi:peptidoglycan/xylan/chitin deacetylase (PgdA/CDA1 family)
MCFFLFGCAALAHLPQQEKEPPAWLTLREAPVKEKEGRYAYLTFDDGPSRNTSQILDILSEFQIKGTFFVVGNEILNNDHLNIEEASSILKRILAEGHFIGLHSMTHDQRRLYWSANAPQNFYNEMRELQSLIYNLTGGFETNLYRAPYGILYSFTDEHITKMTGSNLRGWDWNIDTLDWRLRSVEETLEKVKSDMKDNGNPNNAIILFHENNFSLTALPYVIEHFMELGYAFLPYHPDNHFPMNRIHNPNL